MNSSITSRLILFLTLSAGAIIAVGLMVDYRLSRAEILERLKEDSRQTVEDVVRDLEGLLRGVEGSTRFLGGILQQQNYSELGLERMLSDTVAKNGDVFGATIALNPELVESPRGFAPYYYEGPDQLLRSDLTEGATPYWERPWFTEPATTGEPVWIEPYFDAGGADIYMTTYSVPVYHQDNGHKTLYAVVTADISLAALHRYLRRLELGEHGLGVLVSRSGLVLSSRSPDTRMQHYQTLIENPERVRAWRGIVEGATPGSAPARHIDCELMRGDCTVRMTRLRHTGWALGVVYSEREVLAPLRDYEYKTLAVGLLSLLTMALAVSLVTRRITRPLSALARTADSFGEGNFSAALPRVGGNDEVARLVRSFDSMKSELVRYIADLEQATASRSRLEGELYAAREIQMSMLPQNGEARERGEGFELWATVRPARTVGGDLFTYSQNGRQLHFSVGDVSDKGVPAALFMARVISLLQELEGRRPGETLGELNNALVERNDNCMFVTLLLGTLDLDTLQLTFASAGHTPPMLLRNGLVSSITQRRGPATGLAAGQHFPDNHLQLARGDRLAVYTDGIEEAFNRGDEMFGTDRLGAHLVATQRRALEGAGSSLLAAIDDFSQGVAQSDDITVLLLDLYPPSSAVLHRRRFPLAPTAATDSAQWLQERLQNQPADNVDASLRGELMLMLEEVVSNIHKYAGLRERDEVDVGLELHDSEIVLQVRDRGVPFNPLEESRRAPLGADIASAEIGGLGVHLIVRLSDWQRYRREDGWNCLQLGRRLTGTTAGAPEQRDQT